MSKSNASDLMPKIESGVITYVLCEQSEPRGKVFDEEGNRMPEAKYVERRNLLMRSSMIWPGGKDPFSGKERDSGRYPIRYYDGCTTLFMDNQPDDTDTINQLTISTRERLFVNGHLQVDEVEKMLIKYLDWCSWNEESPYKSPRVQPIFKKLDAEKSRIEMAGTIDEIELAMKYAKDAEDKDMIIHAHFLDIPIIDGITGNPLSLKSIRAEYRNAAMTNAKKFLKTFNDDTLSVKYQIDKAIESGVISVNKVPNKAVWAEKGKIICDISGLTSHESILNKLIELTQVPEGSEFKEQIKLLFK